MKKAGLFRVLLHRFKRFHRLSMPDKIIVFKIFILTAYFRFLILFIPFKKIVSKFGVLMKETSTHVDENKLKNAKHISYYVKKVSQHTLWESKCLVQAVTTQYLLRRRRIPSTLYLGIAKDKDKGLLAHAWLRCGECILTGEDAMKNFKCVAYFGCSV